MKKVRSAVILSLVLALFGMSFLCPAAETEGPDVSMEVSSIYGDMGKLGSHVPLTVSLYGQTEVPFSGSVKIHTLENGTDNTEEVYEYSYPVTVNTAETKTLEICVPLGQRSNELSVSLTAGDGKELDEITVAFDVSKDMGRLVIGALSEEMDKLFFLDGVSLDYGMVNSVLVPMEGESFPENFKGLDILDLLVINHYETASLTEAQRQAILKWVDEGGTLLLGTGAMAYETLEGFYSDFYGLSIVETRKENVGFGVEYADKEPGDSSLTMVCADLWIPGGHEVMESDGQPLLTMVKRGDGNVGFFSYDLGDISQFVEKNPNYAVRILTDVLGDDNISQLYYYSSYDSEREYWNAQSLVNTGSPDRLPKLPLYAAAAVIYILAAGPGLYEILKKRDLGRHYGKAVVLTAVAASAVIYLMGTGTRFTSEFYTVTTILDVAGDEVAETSYLNIRTPDSRPFSVVIPGEYEITPLTRSSRYEDEPVVQFDKRRSANVAIRYDEEETVLSSRRSKAFDPRYFKLEKKAEKQFEGEIGGELTIFEGKASGYLVNGYSFPLTDAVLFLYGQMYSLGTLEPGEAKLFEETELLNWPVNMPYLVSDWLFGRTEKAAHDDSEYLANVEKSGLYSYFMGEYYNSYTSDVRIAAFGPENGLWNYVSSEGQATDGQILYTGTIPVTTEVDGLVCRSGFIQKPRVNSGSGSVYSDGMTMYSGDPLAVEYFLGTDIEVERVSFLPVSEELFSNPELYYLKRFDGDAYFYNYETKTYDYVDLSRQVFTKEELAPYLSAENSLAVKYTAGGADSNGMSTLLPLLMVTGRER